MATNDPQKSAKVVLGLNCAGHAKFQVRCGTVMSIFKSMVRKQRGASSGEDVNPLLKTIGISWSIGQL